MGNTFYNEILTDHNMNPIHKKKLENPTMTLEGVNPSCGDDIILSFVVEDGVIADGGFEGDGCAISQASCDIMLDLCIGKPVDEAKRLAEIFIRMITGKITDEERVLFSRIFHICQLVQSVRFSAGILWKRCLTKSNLGNR